jgi:hypothetical protein
MDIPLSRSDYLRGVAKEAHVRTRNRYFEKNPILTDNQSALLPRMGLRRALPVGDGPMLGIYNQAGSFDNAVFTKSGTQLWRVDTDLSTTLIGTLPAPDLKSFASMAATSNIGVTPAYLFVAAGSTLMCYMENGYATGAISGTPANNDVVQAGTMYYKFTTGSVDAGTPAGTVGNPWLVAIGVTVAGSWQNLADAFSNSGTAGTQYSTVLLANDAITVQAILATGLHVRANAVGALGNTVATTETGAAIAWGGATLSGGGNPSYFEVPTPDNVGIISVGYIASYVVVVPAQGQGINGRFFWIEPGETTIDPLNFATAERAPDPISEVTVFGDEFWLPGSNTTEPWYFTGNFDAPVLRVKGIVFDRGAWEGTAIQVKDSMIIVENAGGVFQIKGGVKRISRPDVEERIREAIAYQAAQEV